MRVVLTQAELREADQIGISRNEAKTPRVRYARPALSKDGDHATGHKIGARGEYAFELLTGLPMNREFYQHGDIGDFAQGIELKCSTWPGPDIDLKVSLAEWRGKPQRIYVLARVTENIVEFLGWIGRPMFETVGRIKGYGKGHLNWVVGVAHLQPMAVLLALITAEQVLREGGDLATPDSPVPAAPEPELAGVGAG